MNLPENAIQQAIQNAPPLVRALAEDDAQISDVTFALGTKHLLRADALGVLFDCTRAMLVGLLSPQGVIAELAAVGVAETTAREILASLNTEIFMPLRAEMQKTGNAVDEKPIVAAPAAPAAPQVPVPSYIAPPLQSPRYTHLDNKISITTVAPLPPKMTMPSAPPAAPAPAAASVPATPPPVAEARGAATMLPSGEGEAHAILPSTAPNQVPMNTPVAPAAVPVMPVVQAAPAPQQAPVSAPQAAPARPLAPTPAPRVDAPVAPKKPNTADPYREPIEG